MNEMHIRALQEAIENIKKADAAIQEYCTDNCEHCPLSDMCDWEGHIDAYDSRITEGVLDSLVDFHEAHEAAQERKTFKEVTGIDPAWYCFNEDRTQGDF